LHPFPQRLANSPLMFATPTVISTTSLRIVKQ
jgi:hypothetical protein